MQLRNCAAMVDIETLDTRPGAIIISIGAILFDPFQLNDPHELTAHTFYMNVDRSTQPESRSSEDTIAWWAKQSKEAQERLLVNPQPIATALRELHNFLCFRNGETHPPAHELWANGPNFDCVNLELAYEKYSKFQLPIKFFKQYCVRTIKETAWRHGEGRPNIEIGIAHNALDDCIKQALYVQLAHAKLGLTTPI